MKVIIVGGGIAGLTFASALERAGIDFVLLEARSLFDPQVGASIGMQASAMRIFDQLGAAQEVIDQTVPFSRNGQRRSDGSPIAEPLLSFQLLERRFGYSTVFLDRQLVLRALDRTITLRDCMLLNRVVRQIGHDDLGVTVHCEDGSSHRGDIVVGCDGVGSKASVRSEMLRIAGEVDPKAFPESEKTKMTAEFSCLFGISTGVTGIIPGDVDITYDTGRSFLMITGKDGRVYWFFFQKLDKKYTYGAEDYPRYSKEDAEKVAAENAWRSCQGVITFGDLWEKRLSYTLVPMEEALFDTWSWGRIATLGDSAHKMTANQGQAGNNAVESAAALANHLKKIHDAGTVDKKTIATALRKWQEKRQVRIEATVKEAARVCRMHALDSISAKAIVFGLLPCAPEAYISSQLVNSMIGAEVLEYLPMPERALSGSCPFNPTYGAGQHESVLKRAVMASPLLLIAFWSARMASFNTFESGGLREVHPAVSILTNWFRLFSPIVDAGLIYAIWLIESNRRANSLTLVQLPVVFGILTQIFGVGIIAPCFYFMHYTFGPLEKFAAADARLTDIAYTRTILPIILFTMAAPIFLITKGISVDLGDNPCKVLSAVLLPLTISTMQRLLVKTGFSTSNVFQDAMTDWNRDLPTIRRTIHGLSFVSSTIWIYNFATWIFNSFEAPLLNALLIRSSAQWNWIAMLFSTRVWLALLDRDLVKGGMKVPAGTLHGLKDVFIVVVAGPAAWSARCWLSREEILATKREKHAITRDIYEGRSIDDVKMEQQPSQHTKQNGHAVHMKQNGHAMQPEQNGTALKKASNGHA